MATAVYLHGFSSSPAGWKATALRALLEPTGVRLVAPDLNVPSFERLAWGPVVEVAVRAAQEHRADVLVGSSLGALVAIEASRRVAAPLVLVAPTLGYGAPWVPPLPAGDPVRVVDRETGASRSVHRAFVEEFLRGPEVIDPPASPVTVIAGRLDTAVPFALVRATFDGWVASGRLAPGSAMLDLPHGDHGMRAYVREIADAIARYARGASAPERRAPPR